MRMRLAVTSHSLNSKPHCMQCSALRSCAVLILPDNNQCLNYHVQIEEGEEEPLVGGEGDDAAADGGLPTTAGAGGADGG